MAASPILTYGFGSFGSVNKLPTLGFGIGAPITSTTGSIVAGEVFIPGAIEAEVYLPGASEAEVYSAGAVEAEVL